MASDNMRGPADAWKASGQRTGGSAWEIARLVLQPLASLKLTVALFALGIGLILFGTLAQVDKDIWEVIDQYFRTPIAKVDLQIFVPPAFFPAAPLDYRAPREWSDGEVNKKRQAAFLVEQDGKRVEIEITNVFPASDSPLGDVNHWRAQLGLPVTTEEELDKAWKSVPLAKGEGDLVELTAPDGKKAPESLLGVRAVRNNKPWYVTMRGDSSLAEAEKDRFLGFVKTVQLPQKIKVAGSFPFPGGWLIGGAMFLNLLAAHLVRFKIQSKGTRLWAGLGVIGLGMIVTALVILSGSNENGLQDQPMVSWSALWKSFQVGLVALWMVGVGGLFSLGEARRVERRMLTGGLIALALVIGWMLWQGTAATLADSSMRILWQLIKGTFAGVVLLAGCVLVFQKRAGIVLLHGGVGLLMGYEIYVGAKAEEGQMTILEGQTSNLVMDIRKCELALIDTSPAKEDDVMVVPQGMVREGNVIRDPQLPIEIEVVRFMKNSAVRRAGPMEENPADAGLGREIIAEALRPAAGADTKGEVDQPSAYVRIKKRGSGESLGTRLISVPLSLRGMSEKLDIDGKSYDLSLRLKHKYLDYSIQLIDFRKDDYLGTKIAKNYSSDVRLIDHRANMDEERRIWMNNPLRYAGETFYQADFGKEPGVQSTVLQVVTNSGWMAPYVACMIVAVGLLAQFWQTLTRFLMRRQAARETGRLVPGDHPAEKLLMPHSFHLFLWIADRLFAAGRSRKQPQPSSIEIRDGAMEFFVPATVVALAIAGFAYVSREPRTPAEQMDLYAAGQLPLVYEGRVKPFDTLARNTLLLISNRQSFVDAQKKPQPAIRWLLDVIADPTAALEHRVFRIENMDVLNTLGLERREGFRYSLSEFRQQIPKFDAEVRKASNIDEEQLNPYQRKLLDLANHVLLYRKLQDAFSELDLPPIGDQEGPAGVMNAVKLAIQRLDESKPPRPVPIAKLKTWQTYATASILAQLDRDEIDPATLGLAKIMHYYGKHDVAEFNKAVADYQTLLNDKPPEDYDAKKTRFEAFFNHAEPFYYATLMYLCAFLLTACSWLGFSRPLNRAALSLILVALAVHTWAIWGRIEISGRPPVTNLYSSAVFIGWGAVLFGVCLEYIYGKGIGNVVGSIVGAMTLGIAHFLAADGDTFTVLQAVLDTQFWLATHVTCITLGYSATGLAGLLGTLHILQGVATPTQDKGTRDALTRMTYGILCFAIFFSFVGTVLGGLWADDSWGRFWGWDPKENGALIIVLWNAIVLHARWGGMVKERGLAVLATCGLVAVAWSWFGVNELGVGLHSYGFTEGRLRALAMFVAGTLCVVGLGLLPKSLWWSYKAIPPKDAEKIA